MKTIDNNILGSDLTNFHSGVNLGYSLGSWNEDADIIKSVNSIAERNSHSPFCRGIITGYERAMLDHRQEKHFERDQRLKELHKAQDHSKDQKELER
jgi:hypothetical protein